MTVSFQPYVLRMGLPVLVWLLLVSLFTTFHPSHVHAENSEDGLLIAAASNLRFPMDEVIAAYGKMAGTKIKVAYGASGSLFTQIIAGAPYDLFFSADEDLPKKLIQAHLAIDGSFFIYGQGRIVLWVLKNASIDLSRDGMNGLLHPSVKKIAIANPRYAPYGQSAIAALKKSGFFDRVKSKLVYGENVSQAADFVRQGGAEIGILSYSLALSPPLERSGRYWLIPGSLYPALNQVGIILLRSRRVPEAESFLQFLKAGAGRKIFEQYGLLNGGFSE